jgi:hypothetical protein
MSRASNAGSAAPAAGTVPSSLGQGTPAFTAFKTADLPQEWRACLADSRTKYVALEIPDVPWGRVYYSWYVNFASTAPPGKYLPAMLLNLHDYNGGSGQQEAAKGVLRSLLETGRPTPAFLRILDEEAMEGTGTAFNVLGERLPPDN